MAEDGEIRIVLMGKTGAGKSSLGNTLLGEDIFDVTAGMSSGTLFNEVRCAHRFGTFIQVTDTPGLCDTHYSEEGVLDEVLESIFRVHPGPHIVLMVLRCDVRFTKEEYSAYSTLKKLCGSEICNHMIVVFNGIDSLDDSPAKQKQALKKDVENYTGRMEELLRDVCFRYYGVNNTAPRSRREQHASDLLEMMEILIAENQGSYIAADDSDSTDSDG